jgi:hypothetical protein
MMANIATYLPELYLKKGKDAMFFCQMADFLWTSNKRASIMNENSFDSDQLTFTLLSIWALVRILDAPQN